VSGVWEETDMVLTDFGSGFSLANLVGMCALSVLCAMVCALTLMLTDGFVQLAKERP